MTRLFNTAGPNKLAQHFSIDPFQRVRWAELHGQALLQLDISPSSHACSNTHPTGHRPIGGRVIAALLSESAEVMDAHNVLSVRHWDRIGRGLLYAGTSAVPWAILHARTFDQDVLLCGRCGGRLRIMKK